MPGACWPRRGEIPRLDAFCALLCRWNRAFNLVSRQDIGRVWVRHVLDSLVVRDLLEGQRIADLGSGAGFPGLPLAITDPGRHFTLLDSSERKVRFLRQAVIELGLDNVEVVHGRAEGFDAAFDTVLARAVAAPRQVVLWGETLVRPGGYLVLYAKAPEVHGSMLVDQEREYRLPGIHGSRWVSRLRAGEGAS